MTDPTVLIYRLTYVTAGQEVSPGHVWGTVEAIEGLEDCGPVYSSERRVPRAILDAHGFLFEHSHGDIAEIEAPKLAAAQVTVRA
jgi:hypothetical protein